MNQSVIPMRLNKIPTDIKLLKKNRRINIGDQSGDFLIKNVLTNRLTRQSVLLMTNKISIDNE